MKDAHRRVLAWSLPLCLLVGTAQSATLTIGADAAYQTLAAAYAAAQPGDVLEIADNGTYNESLSILKADLTLRAAPGVRPTIRGKAASQGAAVYVAADGVTIAGLTLDGIDRSGRVIATLAPTRLTIRDNVIRNGDYGIFTLYTAGDAQGFRIERNDLSGNNTDIWLHNVTGAWVADNRVHSNSGSGIGVGGYSSHIQVVGNQVYADLPPTQLRSRYGILLSGDDNRVEHNEVHGTVQGICLSWSTGNLVAYNRVYDNVSAELRPDRRARQPARRQSRLLHRRPVQGRDSPSCSPTPPATPSANTPRSAPGAVSGSPRTQAPAWTTGCAIHCS